MSTIILRGAEAVHYAKVHNLKLNRDAGDAGPASDDLGIDDGEAMLENHGHLVWVEAHMHINPGDHD